MVKFFTSLFFTFYFSLFNAKAQQQYLPINNSINDIVESAIIQKGVNFHTSIRPYKINEINKIINLDSLYETLNLHVNSNLLKRFLNADNLYNTNAPHKFSVSANLLLSAEGGYDLTNKDKALNTGAGINLNGNIGKNLSFSANVFFNNSKYFEYIDNQIKLSNVIPGEGKAINSNLGYFYKTLTFYLTYSPSKYFNFEIGKGKNFWGDGYRSLLLSDNANSYPYLKITTNFWHLKYVNLYANLRNIDAPGLGVTEDKGRYTAMHYLSWNITKWWNLSFFEAIMFDAKDTTGKRGFDINYLNPVVIYRPVEYSLGSPDNELLGANMNFRIAKKTQIYFQLMLDEFLLSHVKAHDGWWANKQAFQLGFKTFDLLGIKSLNLQSEFNFVRPYTYTHFNINSNYSDYNQALAAPLGANFKESVTIIHYRYKRWQYSLKYNYAIYGSDIGNMNYGQNIFKTDEFLITFFRPLGNFVGQGLKNTLQYREVNVSYTLNPKSNLIIEAGITNRNLKNSIYTNNANFIYIGIKTLIDNQYFDF